VMWR